MPSRHSSGVSAPLPADPGLPSPQNEIHRCLQTAAGAAPRPPPPHTGNGSPPLARARPAPTSSCGLPARGCGAVRGRGQLHPAAGRAAGAAPLASPRGQPQGGGMAAALPAVHGARGEGEGKRGKSDPSAGSFPRPSLGCGSSLLPTVNAEAASAPAPSPALSPCRHKGKLRYFLLLPGNGDQQV